MDLGIAIVLIMILSAAFGVIFILGIGGFDFEDFFKSFAKKWPADEERELKTWANDYLSAGRITIKQYNDLMFGELFLRSGIPSKRKYYKYAYKAEYGEEVLINITKEITSLTPEQVIEKYKFDDLYINSLYEGSKAISIGTLYCRSDRYDKMTEKQFKQKLNNINKEN